MSETVKQETTAADMLAAWDRGEIVATVEMGGLGPGYEQAIQMLTFEIVRDYVGQEIPEPSTPEMEGFWPAFGEAAIARTDDAAGGYTGAMVGAAKQLAYNLLRKGWDQCRSEIEAQFGPERIIQVSRAFPQAPEVAHG